MNEIKILGYGNVKEISNSEKDILIFFNINKQIIGLNYVLSGTFKQSYRKIFL